MAKKRNYKQMKRIINKRMNLNMKNFMSDNKDKKQPPGFKGQWS